MLKEIRLFLTFAEANEIGTHSFRCTEKIKHAGTITRNFLIELENREKKLVRDTDINNCRANRRECLSVKGKLLFFEGGQPNSRVARDSYFSIYLTLQHETIQFFILKRTSAIDL